MNLTHLKCPKCAEIIMKSTDGDLKVRCRVMVIKGNEVFSICKGCNSEVKVPLILDAGPPLILDR